MGTARGSRQASPARRFKSHRQQPIIAAVAPAKATSAPSTPRSSAPTSANAAVKWMPMRTAAINAKAPNRCNAAS